MLNPKTIISWLAGKVNGMRRSRLKTLAALVAAAMRRAGVGVLALGRAMAGRTSAKHCIKRVWRFLKNESVEQEAVHRALLGQSLHAVTPSIVLADWTDLYPFQSLVLAVARDGRALPFHSKTIPKKCGTGRKVDADARALEFLSAALPSETEATVVADRGFGRTRWIKEVCRCGLRFVQRLDKGLTVYTGAGSYCKLSELAVERGEPARDWGMCTLGEKNPFSARLLTVWRADSEEPLYLVTNREDSPAQIVALYLQRMWIEAMFRDLKNRKWGLGMADVRLSEPGRHDRHFLVLFLAYFFQVAFGAVAEARGFGRLLKANTVACRVLSLATIGFLAMKKIRCSINTAIKHLRLGQCKIKTGDC